MAIGPIGTLSLAVFFGLVILYRLAKRVRVWYLMSKFEGPFSLPILGTTYRLKSDPRERFEDIRYLAEKYRQRTGGIFRLWFGPKPALVIYNAKHVEVILSSSRHLQKGSLYKNIEPWLGKGLLTSTGAKWFHRRKLLTPTFHFSILQTFIDVFNEQSFVFAKKMEQFADSPEPFNIFPHIANCVLDIICSTAMGKQIHAQSENENEYVNAVLKISGTVSGRGITPWMQSDFIFNRTEMGKQQTKYLKILHGVTDTMIQERLRDPPKPAQSTGDEDDIKLSRKQKRVAFLDLLLQMHREDKNFTLKDIREEVDTFMFEGHDTTAAATAWAIHQIGHHPEIQRRLHEEIDEIFGDSDRPVTSDDLGKMPYLNRVAREALRLLPSVPSIGRCLEEDLILDGKLVPKDTMIQMQIFNLHRDPDQFPDPERFDPDRFLPENVAKRHPFAYVPFSAGPRNCIGQKFAQMEDKVILVNLLRRFSIQSMQTIDETKPAGQLIVRPAHGNILVKFSTRKGIKIDN